MITFPDSGKFLDILSRSHLITARATLYDGNQPVPNIARLVSGEITVDRSAQARRTLSGEVALAQQEDYVIPIDTLHSRTQIWLGVLDGLTPLWVSGGVFRINTVDRTNRGSLAITGSSLEAYVIEDVYTQPKTYPIYTPILFAIQDTITSSFASATFGPFSAKVLDADAPLPGPVTVDEDRWAMVETLSSIINCDVYCDPFGVFQIVYKPTLSDVAVASIHEGEDGVLVEVKAGVSREDTYNAVLAMGQSSNTDIPPVSAIVRDTDPNSPTFWGGPFGKRTYPYTNELLTTKEMCQAKARILLNELRAQTRSVSFNAIPNPLLEPGDVVIIDMLDGTTEKHMLGSLTIPVGLGDWSGTTIVAKDLPELLPPPELFRNYDVVRLFEPDQETLITPNTYQGVLDDYKNYGKVLFP
jgi:hypothetical protein